MLAGSAQAAQGFSLFIFPFTFISSAYVPVASMPTWLQGFAENQPVTLMINSIRALTEGAQAEAMLGHTAAYFAVRAVLWCAAMVAVFAPLAIWRYRRG